MFTAADPPGSTVPVLAITNSTVCVPEFPATQIRPTEDTSSGLTPTVNFMPTQPLKLLRRIGWVNAYPVRKLVDAVLHWKLAVTVVAADIVTVSGFAVPNPPPQL